MKQINGKWMPTVTKTHILGFFGAYRWLSNFHASPIQYRGIEFPSAEHAYQAMKSEDPEVWRLVANLPTPKEAKSWGLTRIQLREGWVDENIRYTEMRKIVRRKFSQNPELLDLLLATEDLILVETNYWNDTYWGMCRGSGENRLGEILMDVRRSISES